MANIYTSKKRALICINFDFYYRIIEKVVLCLIALLPFDDDAELCLPFMRHFEQSCGESSKAFDYTVRQQIMDSLVVLFSQKSLNRTTLLSKDLKNCQLKASWSHFNRGYFKITLKTCDGHCIFHNFGHFGKVWKSTILYKLWTHWLCFLVRKV